MVAQQDVLAGVDDSVDKSAPGEHAGGNGSGGGRNQRGAGSGSYVRLALLGGVHVMPVSAALRAVLNGKDAMAIMMAASSLAVRGMTAPSRTRTRLSHAS
jgi:hypothetical protein